MKKYSLEFVIRLVSFCLVVCICVLTVFRVRISVLSTHNFLLSLVLKQFFCFVLLKFRNSCEVSTVFGLLVE